MKIRGIVAVLLFSGVIFSSAQQIEQPPKLVVGMVVDQMRWDQLYRFEKHFGEGGFNRLLKEGYNFNNVMINYIPTVTALGHTSVYTGSVPSIHGIAGNDWTDRRTGQNVYCTTDASVKGVGSSSEKIGAHSPHNLWSTTITDQLRMASNFRSKVVGVSLKDRAAILPAGHNPTAAFWFDEGTGHFVTSSYYMNELPEWVRKFNSKDIGSQLVRNGWNTLKDIREYKESTEDNMPWENTIGSAKEPVFPYSNLAKDYNEKKGVIRSTPFGNTLTLRMAEASLEGYQLGRGEETDFLVVNIASTDYVGHTFGPNSIEVQDTYLRLDKDLEIFLNALDQKVGKGNYLFFLTSDHGAAHSVAYMKQNKMSSDFFDKDLLSGLEKELETLLGQKDLIYTIDNYQVYFNESSIMKNGLSLEQVSKATTDYLNRDPRVLYAVDLSKVGSAPIPEPIKSRIINGYNWQRSGHIQIISHDAMLPSYSLKGTTHSVWNSYDAHIPLIFMGKGISQGQSSKPYYMTDIAPTLAQLLKIENPSGNIGEPIVELLD
ncbi:alkaline phosphatase PafA [Planobacterium oryzisoli]|uniref:Alkaline phosphatase family protein n=1 Tax=Planobacterium oryzisoli TaxID=2771435 RepID=A0A931E9A6_9FLAO|nr:alkaline phosphatase PafA [Planobacterium oryzisoli]MBF5026543.1 alkaline phosphatase family protein [Planobacterium oryzisoli]